MFSRARTFVAPAYLLACLILGGSAQGIWANMFLQLSGIAIIAWAAFEKDDEALAPAARQLMLLSIVAVAIVAAQLIPVPASIWSTLGPRHAVAEGFRILGQPAPAQPLSLTPASTLNSLLGIIPPLALICAIARLRAYTGRWLVIGLIFGMLAGVALGALQVSSADPSTSPYYLYYDTNWGSAVGFFANADHMATLLIVTIPFLFAAAAAAQRTSVQHFSAIIAALAALLIVVLVGLVLNGSLAGFGLAVPTTAASALLILSRRPRLRLWLLGATAVLVIGAITAVELTEIGGASIGQHATNAAFSRAEVASTTLRATAEFMPYGSGLGSFRSVYPIYEDRVQVTPAYVVHAHDDYLEIALELGIAGVILMLCFFAWWAAAVWRSWRSAEAGPFARAATIASAAVLIHSVVDFPLRTAAIAACFGVCLGLIADSRAAPRAEKTDLRRARHVVI